MTRVAWWFLIISSLLNCKASVNAATCEQGKGPKITLVEITNHYTDVLQGLDVALDKYNSQSNSVYRFVFLPSSIDARYALQGGNHFCVSVQIAPSTCRNTPENASKRIETCPVNFTDLTVATQIKWCEFHIFSRPWLGRLDILKSDCQPTQ